MMNAKNHLSASISNFMEIKGADVKDSVNLIVKGQGTVAVSSEDEEKITELIFEIGSKDKGVQICIESNQTIVKYKNNSSWNIHKQIGTGIDPDPSCQYWLSIDDHNYRVRYGIGEMRPGTMIIDLEDSYFKPEGEETNSWLHDIQSIDIKHDYIKPKCIVLEKPVTVSPPLIVVNTDHISMDDVAKNKKVVIQNLPFACQQLFSNVGGKEFLLNTIDFPEFEDAINYSINNPDGWCYKKLEEKASEFGHYEPEETYLRITMGVNQGNSPGIPYVMEIWPYQHYSPIHNHAGANAIIRVLAGEIHVSLYSMLSKYHEKPFATKTFTKDQLTWITPDINQVHQLKNISPSKKACITIQCYQYGTKNTEHYEYFDYIGGKETGEEIEKFVPNSDMEFTEFKALMKEEWENR